jgi:YVTN family beta-propeller protein
MRRLSVATTIASSILGLLSFSAVAQQNSVELNFDYFKNEVQPVFLAKRDGNIRCIQCHTRSSGYRVQALEEHQLFFTEEQSRMNFESASQFVVPGADPLQSRFLTHPLAVAAGGDPFHGGGKHFPSQDDPEWRVMADWVAGATSRREPSELVVRIVQTTAAGDNSSIIDPATNKIVGKIGDIEIPHGVVGAPDGTQIYITNESMHSLDIIDARTLRVKRRIPLSGRPNNVGVTGDGSKVYVAIMESPGAVDIIDVKSMTKIKTVPVNGAIHNVYVTPDSKYAVAGSIQTRTVNVIDTATDEVAWELEMSAGIRPMTFSTNPDGWTKSIFVQLSGFHGFAVVDFEKQAEVARIEHPAVAGQEAHYDGLQGAPAHGLGVPPNGETVWSTSKVYSHAYIYSLPELEPVGQVFVGQHPEWITFTPDGKTAYVGAAGDHVTYAVDVETLTVDAVIPVGQVPKRVGTVLMAVD